MKRRLKDNWRLMRGMQRRADRAQLTLVAAGGAFFGMLSLFPALAAVIAVLGFFSDPSVISSQLAMIEEFIPQEAYSIIEQQITRISQTNSSTLGWATIISLGATLWSARLGTDAMIRSLNAVYGAPVYGGLWAYIVPLGLTLAMIFVAVIAAMTMVVIPVILAFLPLGPLSTFLIDAARWILALVTVMSGIWILYRFAPNLRGTKLAWINPGAILTILVWTAGSVGFSFYVAHFAAYNEVYGSIGAVIALMMFLYLTILVLLIGATLNAELHEIRGKSDAMPKDFSTVGEAAQPAALPKGIAARPAMP